jgi:hypothetical protein
MLSASCIRAPIRFPALRLTVERSDVGPHSLGVQPLVQTLEQSDRLVEPELLSLPALRGIAQSPPLDGIV